jgi:hypothetical protein
MGKRFTFAKLETQDQILRGSFLLVIAVLTVVLRAAEPAQIGAQFPFRTSCGAITGLPCIFCGLTRALHHLLCGDLATAFYFNWLAVPISIGAILLFGLFAVELICEHKLVALERIICITPRKVPIGLCVLVSLWLLQVYLAVSQSKHELLNPDGPLYRLFVK